MSNVFFDAVFSEEAPMYDASIIDENGLQNWQSPVSNNANNSHSVTKFFVAAAIGILCDRGLMSVDDKVTSFFSEKETGVIADKKWNDVSVRFALQHKTGMDYIPYGVDEDSDIEKIGNDFLKYIFSLEIQHEPGTFYRYSDAAFYLLGRIINKVSGMKTQEFFRRNIMNPLSFGQWSMATCPEGYPICGGGFFARSQDVAKLGYTYACNGIYNGKRIISEKWIDMSMKEDFACTQFRQSGIFLKTGARGQVVAFSKEKKAAVAWHGCAFPDDKGKRNDRLLEAFEAYLKTI